MMKTDTATDPSSQTTQCTAEDKQMLQVWEKMFTNRFTDDDPHYKPYKGKDPDPPPIVDNYFIRKPRQYDNSQGRGGGGGWQRGHKRHYDDRDSWQHQGGQRRGRGGWDRGYRDRDWGRSGYGDNRRYSGDSGYSRGGHGSGHRSGYGGDKGYQSREGYSYNQSGQQRQNWDQRQGGGNQGNRRDRDQRSDRDQSRDKQTDNSGKRQQQKQLDPEWD